MKTPPKKLTPRKLLVASVGVATLNYVAVACNGLDTTSGNLPSPQPTSTSPTSGNLPAPEPSPDPRLDAGSDTDAASDASAGSDADADAGS